MTYVFGLAVLVVIAALVWAASSTLPANRLSQLRSYPGVIAPVSTSGDTFTVMTYNVGFLSGMSNGLPFRENKSFFQENLERASNLLQTIRPDFVGLQEVDLPSHRSHYINQVDSLAQNSGYSQAAFAVNWDKKYVPYPLWPPSGHFGRVLSGQAVLSHFPIVFHQRVVLAKPQERPFYWNAFYLDRLAQVVKVNVGRELVIINIHLEAYEQLTRARQAEVVLGLFRKYRQNYPVLLLGDFNSLSPFAGLEKNTRSGLPAIYTEDSTVKIFVDEPSLEAAFPRKIFAETESLTYTYSSTQPTNKIDFIFYDATRIEPVTAFVASEAGPASDHLPVVFRFRFREERN